ncbi:glycosyltransferase family 1 protein [Bacillus halotolerans]|uniref:Glycosyltransferase family 1 protein n=1 Tax=Bacillus halotolerans TaxID=260554 RepID=A0ABY7HZL5_9BACI|nr:glycosyltransferase family 1 protein [Bacillus halotolerans]MBL4966521.1 glycosyltransferase family 1 protein [Bacillus halotolerans]MCC2115250.1 glycosyltransferase family 1 protein [Bacillus halotolerans]MDG0764877.1 glycosyltransferase family 1 protein [Bacillus halotolerans]MDQ7725480.1 glycosyltransferase family 1 protein [Bacillus halotolerans]MEC1544942.1 glycosyltransferase family 1 protein [Bacillus halotolerans]
MNNSQQRVLHVLSGMNRGGAETMVMNLYRKMDRSKVQFDFLTYRNDPCAYDEEILSLGGRLFYVPSIGQSNPLTFVKNVRNIIKENGPFSAVHAHTDFQTGFIALAARLAGVQVRVCHSHNTSWKTGFNWKDRLQLMVFRRLILAYATELCACGEDAGRFLFGRSNMERKRVHLLPNGIDLDLFSPAGQAADDEKKARGIASDRLIIGHVARFHEVKNHAFLLKLAVHLKKRGVRFQMVLAGDGPLREQMEEEARRLNLLSDVLFLGTEEHIHELMRTFDVFVMPSLYEGLPVVLVEAQASGLPCIISDTITEKVDTGLGLVKRVSLSKPMDIWAETIVRAAAAGRPKRELVKDTLAKLGYDARRNVGALMNLYQISTEKGQ